MPFDSLIRCMSCTLCKLYLLDQHCQEAMFNFDFCCLFLLGGESVVGAGWGATGEGRKQCSLVIKGCEVC